MVVGGLGHCALVVAGGDSGGGGPLWQDGSGAANAQGCYEIERFPLLCTMAARGLHCPDLGGFVPCGFVDAAALLHVDAVSLGPRFIRRTDALDGNKFGVLCGEGSIEW